MLIYLLVHFAPLNLSLHHNKTDSLQSNTSVFCLHTAVCLGNGLEYMGHLGGSFSQASINT